MILSALPWCRPTIVPASSTPRTLLVKPTALAVVFSEAPRASARGILIWIAELRDPCAVARPFTKEMVTERRGDPFNAVGTRAHPPLTRSHGRPSLTTMQTASSKRTNKGE